MIEAQTKIKSVIGAYKQFYADEYLFVCKQIAEKRKQLKNPFGDMSKHSDMVERPLTEIPETLFTLFQKSLTEDELMYYSSKPGTRWFAKTYPEFRAGDKV